MKKIVKIVFTGCLLLGLVFFVIIKNTSGCSNAIVLKRDVNAGAVITDDMLSIVSIPNTVFPKDVIVNKKDVLGKTLSVPRLKGDYIPKSAVKKVNITLKDNEVAFSLRIPKDDTRLIQQGGEIALSLISNSNTEPLLVKGIYVMAINSLDEQQTSEQPTDLIIAKTTDLIGNKIAPYLKNNNYKVLVLPQNTENNSTPNTTTNVDANKNTSDKTK
ncbi:MULTISPECIES: SAF domain-containing protein [Clostridium]|jgi:hypothetical protein|uniref:SAF domain-containing protein n=1 Tax=Clostridium TaxID=1485 RepID=UPI000E9E0B33|nr:SAF domain-containing protein [Clostridium tyrobutyricum]HBF76986.1 hypothetical protein [Clostridiaceae bacterium]